MKHEMKRIKIVAMATAMAACATHAWEGLPDCKYVALGWEFNVATPEKLLDHAAAFDATALDGVGLRLVMTRPAGTRLSTRDVFTDPTWTRADVEPLVEPLRKLTVHRAFRETLLQTMHSPYKRISWYDDEKWATISNNFRQVAWLAKHCGARGFWVDPEDYRYQDQFVRAGDEPPYDEIAAVARRRGREVFGGMFAEFTDPVVLGFWLFSFQRRAAITPDPGRLLAESGDLWVAFLNGVLDVAPPGARFVDGNEDSYHFEPDMHHYVRNSFRQSRRLLSVVAPENREKYRAQLLAGSAIYMDMYVNENPKGRYYRGPLDGTRVRKFEKDLYAATFASGGYLWFWGETHPWINWKPSARQPRTISKMRWCDSIPGLDLAMRAVKNPHALYMEHGEELIAAFGGTNLVADSMCDKAPYPSWQDKRYGEGTFELDGACGEGGGASICATGVRNGCFTATVRDLRGGDYYEVAVSVLGEASMTVKWFGRDDRRRIGRFDEELNSAHVPIEGADAKKWRRARTMVRVPYGTTCASLLMNVHQSAGQKTWFDNVVIRKVLDFGEGGKVENWNSGKAE